MRSYRAFIFIALVTSLATLAGCATEPTTTADLMRGHASDEQAQVDQKTQIANDWDKAQELVDSGNRNIEDGLVKVKSAEEDLNEGNEQIERGNLQVIEGNRLMQDSMRRFRDAFPDLDL